MASCSLIRQPAGGAWAPADRLAATFDELAQPVDDGQLAAGADARVDAQGAALPGGPAVQDHGRHPENDKPRNVFVGDEDRPQGMVADGHRPQASSQIGRKRLDQEPRAGTYSPRCASAHGDHRVDLQGDDRRR